MRQLECHVLSFSAIIVDVPLETEDMSEIKLEPVLAGVQDKCGFGNAALAVHRSGAYAAPPRAPVPSGYLEAPGTSSSFGWVCSGSAAAADGLHNGGAPCRDQRAARTRNQCE